jgi:hypothetical protein
MKSKRLTIHHRAAHNAAKNVELPSGGGYKKMAWMGYHFIAVAASAKVPTSGLLSASTFTGVASLCTSMLSSSGTSQSIRPATAAAARSSFEASLVRRV